jgi:hypothetical protein
MRLMMASVLRATILIVLVFTITVFFTTKCTFGETTHYISKSLGSDSNNGTGKSTPWAHLPGMPSCSGNCAAYSPLAGDQFILYGGDTWGASDLGVNWQWGGTSGNPVYVGVDQTWFNSGVCGSSWCRPIFNCQNTTCSSNTSLAQVFSINGSYVTVDNIEVTGWQENSSGSAPLIATIFDHTIVENCYFHGWSHGAGSNDNGSNAAFSSNISNGEAGVVGATFHDNVVDGSDTSEDMMNGVIHADVVYNNVIRYVVSGLLGEITDAHSNLIEQAVVSYAGDHCNQAFMFSALTGTVQYAYNNVIRNPGSCNGGSTLWVATTLGTGSCSNCVGYIYNNVIYGVASAFGAITVGYHPPPTGAANTGTYYVYNNVVDVGGGTDGTCMGNGEASPRSVTYYSNNQCIAAPTAICNGTGTTCTNNGTNLSQTEAQANSAAYTSSQTYAYSPTAANSPTVGAATNYTNLCSGAGAALCSDTTYPEYNSTNHTVVLRTVNARPGSGAWDIGAYQFSSSQAKAPAAPTNLQYTVQ